MEGFSQYNQLDLKGLYLYRLNEDATVPPKTEWVDIKEIREELNVYESLFSTSLSAQLLVTDPYNIVDTFPILGGERIIVEYKTPLHAEYISKEFVVYKVGARQYDVNATQKGAMYNLFLCTPDKYKDVNIDISQAFKGTYKDIIESLLKDILKTATPYRLEDSLGINTFIAPYWSPLKCIAHCVSRCYDENLSPFFFYESFIEGYRLAPYTFLVKQTPYKTLYNEPKRYDGKLENTSKVLNSVNRIQTYDTNDKLKAFAKASYGANLYAIDLKDKTISLNQFDYANHFTSTGLHLEEFPLSDGMAKDRNKVKFTVVKTDNSHLVAFSKNTINSLLDNYKVSVEVLGDSNLIVGMIIEMDVPSNQVSAQGRIEQTISGKWLITEVRHILSRERYKMNLCLVKDSHKIDLGLGTSISKTPEPQTQEIDK